MILSKDKFDWITLKIIFQVRKVRFGLLPNYLGNELCLYQFVCFSEEVDEWWRDTAQFMLEDQRQLNVPLMSNNPESRENTDSMPERCCVFSQCVSVLEWLSYSSWSVCGRPERRDARKGCFGIHDGSYVPYIYTPFVFTSIDDVIQNLCDENAYHPRSSTGIA